jgi:cytochrome oxidase Cu insertion factor (SCO1/SenC/PrrC family)
VTTDAPPPDGPVTPSGPRWLNPYVIAFLVGVIFLTVMPRLQKRFLKAPPPIAPLGEWTLSTVDDGHPFGSAQLMGKVVLFSFVPAPCDERCVEAQRAFGRGLEHTDDLGDGVHFVSLVRQDAAPAVRALALGRWQLVTGPDDKLAPVLASFHAAWATRGGFDAGSTVAEQVALPAFALVDQHGMVRDFWRADNAGRGNAINAARLLAAHGPNP